ncbi:hypothetical protein [Microbacterium pumilum]|uniref:PD40 domain-containing protein n=1 Tax=Microbacterium pumilum TaxID=344165 RepID=A0ABN2RUX0_9MICO
MMPASILRTASATAVGALLIAGLVTTSPAPGAQAAPLPAGAETFDVTAGHGGESQNAFLTADAQRVLFTSTASDLVDGDVNGQADIFLKAAIPGSDDPFSGSATLVSAPDGPVAATRANGASDEAVASADARYVAFTSSATNLVALPSTGDGRTYIYVRDTLANRTIRIQGGEEPDGSSYRPDLSDDGRRLVFTSDAGNLGAPGADTNATTDTFVVDLDANGDGTIGDLLVIKLFPNDQVEPGTHDAVISGNGAIVGVLTRWTPGAGYIADTDSLYAVKLGSGALQVGDSGFVQSQVLGRPSVDATGTVFAFVKDQACALGSEGVAVVASLTSVSGIFSVAVGTILTDMRSGWVADPVVSADGSTIAWTTTVPPFDFGNGGVPAPPLAEAVVRVQQASWWDASGTESATCSGILAGEWYDVAEGAHATLSATGRSLAFQSPEPAGIHVVDRHSSDGLSVTSVQGSIITPSFVTEVPIANIPLTSLRDYAATLADSPIYRLPIYRLPIYRLPIYRLPIYRLLVEDAPIYRLPIYRLPIYRLPIYRLDLPGGWPQVLEGTPFADELLHTVTLDEVLAWADDNPGTGASDRIHSLTLVDVGLQGSGLDALSLASYALGNAPVADLTIPGTGSNLERWQTRVDAQGLGVTVDGETVLADLDAAGLDIAATGIEQLSLSDLDDSVIDETLLGLLVIDPDLLPGTPMGAIEVTTLDLEARLALFGDQGVTGTLAQPSVPLLDTATFGDLAKGASSLTFGDVLFSLLDADSYPWEQISASSIDPRDASGYSPQSCVGGTRCTYDSPFRFSFDVGPGEPTRFVAPTASVTLPTGTVPLELKARGSGPGVAWNSSAAYSGPAAIDGSLITVPMADTEAGTVFELAAVYSPATFNGDISATAVLTSGTQRAVSTLSGATALSRWDDPSHTWSADSGWEQGFEGVVLRPGTLYYEWISPSDLTTDDTGATVQGPALDEDFYLVDPPAPGKRLVLSTNASDGQISLSLYSRTGAASAALGVANAGPAPGTAVTEQNTSGEPSLAGADAATAIQGRTLVDQAVQRGAGTSSVEAASTDAAAGEQLLVRVASGNGRPSSTMYSLRVQYLDEPVETVCTPWTPAFQTDPSSVPVSDPLTDATNTIYLVDTGRYDATFGPGATDQAKLALASLSGTGEVGGSTVQGAVLSVDASPGVVAARAASDQNPCSMSAREALTTAINDYVTQQLGDRRDQIRSVVVVGGDEVIPMAPVAQHTSQFTESSHAGDLRLSATPTGAECPAEVEAGALDACATPLSAAAAASVILTDDPYGLAKAYESLGGYLYVPTTALGRLVEGPEGVQTIAKSFLDADGTLPAPGVLDADSTLTAGYGAWSELPEDVTAALSWRSSSNATLGADDPDGLWDAADMADSLFPSDGNTPRVVSINTHADETRMLPGVDDAESGAFDDADLFTTDSVSSPEDLSGSLVFLIGCHAGNNLPAAYYGQDARDWVDVFSNAAGYVGNTGYGLANDVTTALSERLLAMYANWIGVQVDGEKVSASEALLYAKQSYLGGLGLYSGYDEKVLMEAVYYGLPMYTFADAATTKDAPVPEIPAALEDLQTSGGLSTAALTLTPSFQKRTTQDASGAEVSYLVADGQDPAVISGQPVLPKIVSQLRPEDGLTPRGALITALTSEVEDGVTPAIAEAGVGTNDTRATRTDLAFPSSFATITKQDTPDGPADFLVVTPGRVEAPRGSTAGTGSFERFTSLDLDVVYGPADAADTTPPSVSAMETSRGIFSFAVDGTGSAATRGIVLVQPEGETAWQRLDVSFADGTGTATLPQDGRSYRWILQVADAAGNVVVDTDRGHLDVESAPAPSLGDAGGTAVVAAGASLRREVEVTDAAAGERLTGRVTATAVGSSAASATSVAAVVTGPDGATRAMIDQVFTTPGEYAVTLTICRADACTSAEFPVEVPLPNAAPSASVALSSDADPVTPTSVLTADAEGTDPDGDPVALSYAWTRNGAPVGDDSATLALDGIASPGDVIGVTATPNDGKTAGHAASASIQVPIPPAPPVITATATNAAGAYVADTWSRSAVDIRFTCTSGAAVLNCPPSRTIADDTGRGSLTVSGTMSDVLGRSATANIVVKVDRSAPALAPKVTPATVAVGGTAVATANATDAGSGVASQSCDSPVTATAGTKSVSCRATDVAGNTATSDATYTVEAPKPLTCAGRADRTALAPVNADGSSVFLRTSGVPVIFSACDAKGVPIGTRGFVTGVTLLSTTTLPAGAKVTELWYPPVGAFTYVRATKTWLGHISTFHLATGKKYTYRVTLADGTSFTVTFGVR